MNPVSSDGRGVLTTSKTGAIKRRKRTVAQILKEAYRRHCRDRATRRALRQFLKN